MRISTSDIRNFADAGADITNNHADIHMSLIFIFDDDSQLSTCYL
jgi:3D (Asp-Asp-Asp) domain-containing protein